ncbi:MAG: adenylate/guanylate cyclase domain-containing protein [Sandaracinus sp.]
MPRISIIAPEGRAEADLLPHNTLGRHPNNTVQILDRIVSKEHCHIDLVDGRYVLRDLGSLNGSFVNGERITERVLSPGDEISIGSTRIVFDPDGAAARPRASGQMPQPVIQPAAPPQQGMLPPGPAAYPQAPQGYPPAPAAQAQPFVPAAAGTAVGMGPPLQARPAAPWPQQPQPQPQPQSYPMPPQPAPAPPPTQSISKVTIAPGMVESHIRTRLGMEQNFMPEKLIYDVDTLRRDYEKLRVSYELARAIGAELDVQKVLERILVAAFQTLNADRGVILLYDDNKVLQPRCVRNRQGNQDPNENVLISQTIVDQVTRTREAVLSSDATVDSRFQGAHSIIMQGIRSSMAVPLLHSSELFGLMLLDSQIATNAFTEKDLQLFQNVANQASIAIQNSLFAKKLEQEAVTRDKFQRLLSPQIAQQVLDGKVDIAKGGEARHTTVLFSDIRGFTSMSESENPQTIVDMLNEYFELMVDVIFKYEGTLDKFVGDEIMALFGSPVGHADDPKRAVRTALEMMEVLAQLNHTRRGRGEPEIKIGIGINSGEVVAGYLGSSKALEYTVIGDTVNTGARLCSVAKAGEVIISHNTYQHLGNDFECIELPPVNVKGKSQALRIYNVVGERKGSFSTERTRPA